MEATIITVVCSNCNKIIKLKDGQGVAGISHSVCPECIPIVYGDFFTKDEINELLREEAL